MRQLGSNMKCFRCNHQCRTIYPTNLKHRYVQSICPECKWTSMPIQIPGPVKWGESQWIVLGLMKCRSIGLSSSIQLVRIHSVMSAIYTGKSNGHSKTSIQPLWLMLHGQCLGINRDGFGFVWIVGVKKNESPPFIEPNESNFSDNTGEFTRRTWQST